MDDNNFFGQEVTKEILFGKPLVIEKLTEGDRTEYIVAFLSVVDKEKQENQFIGMSVESLEEIPGAMYSLGAFVIKEFLGWKPEAIAAPKSKLIIPGR
jgi:hypothetical protein